jgi:O-antigen/teichoic acid export membrane protein
MVYSGIGIMLSSMTGKDRLEKKYFIFIGILIVAIGIFGALTGQLLITAVLIVMMACCTIILNRYKKGAWVLDDPEGGEVILAAVIVTVAGALVSVWLLWAIAIAALLLIQQSLSRIEQRLAATEKK